MNTEDNRISLEKIMKFKSFIILVVKPFKVWIKWQVIVMLLLSVIEYQLNPQLLRTIINQAARLDINSSSIVRYIIYYLIASIFIAVFYRLSEWLWLKFNSPLKRSIGTRLMNVVMSNSTLCLGKNFSGNVINKINDVMEGVPELARSLSVIAVRIVSIILSVLTVYSIGYKLSILLIIWILAFILGSIFTLKRAHKLNYKSAKTRSVVVGHMVDICNNLLSVQLFVNRSTEESTINSYFSRYVDLEQRKDWFFIKMFCLQAFSFISYQAIGFALLVRGLHIGNVTAGDFALLIYINVSVLKALWVTSGELMKASDMIGRVIQGLDMIFPSLDLKANINTRELIVTKGRIVFESVNFTHEKAESLFFKDQSIIIEPQEKVGLVGYSGSGKTTFLNLILRIYDIEEGSIKIDDQDINYLSRDSLRQSISMVAQDPILFHRSIMENIRYGNPEATDDQVIEAAKLAQAHNFIINFAHGYYEIVGERGIKLSGGQRQLIAIARAILKNSPILIMDEATSQLDSITELMVQTAMSTVMKNRTTLVAAHRVSTLRAMDRILVFDKGKIIVENGSHESLIEQTSSMYYKMWRSQVEGFYV
jgi:ATP-binding cassette subfamily B protein